MVMVTWDCVDNSRQSKMLHVLEAWRIIYDMQHITVSVTHRRKQPHTKLRVRNCDALYALAAYIYQSEMNRDESRYIHDVRF